jgi:signal transduction histidine kinase
MTLSRRVLLVSVVLAVLAAALLSSVVSLLRARERARLLDHVSEAFLTDVARESCESDPQWFLAGPRAGRPSRADRALPDADVRLPRPGTDPLPFEFYAYDEQYLGSSVAAPRFSNDMKRLMRQSPPQRVVGGRYDDERGRGLQIARWTGWVPGSCAVLLFRLPDESGGFWSAAGLFLLAFGAALGVALAAGLPVAARVRKLMTAATASARQDYSGFAPISGHDEVSSLGALFNETASDIRTRITDAHDREEALRRYMASTTEDVAAPLADLEAPLARLAGAQPAGSEAAQLAHQVSREAHRLSMRLQNLAAVTRLRGVTETAPRERVPLSDLTASVVHEREPLAAGARVSLAAAIDPDVVIDADATLVRQAIANVIDNAILYAGPHARILVELKSYEHGRRFALRVVDTGRGVSDEEFAGLTANRRFRGDEARTRRPNERGLGLALAREVADRFGLQLEVRRPSAGGLEVELSTRGSDLFSTAFRP